MVMQVHAYALLRGHNCEYLMQKREMVLGRGDDMQTSSLDVVKVSESKKVSRRAVRIRYNDKNE